MTCIRTIPLRSPLVEHKRRRDTSEDLNSQAEYVQTQVSLEIQVVPSTKRLLIYLSHKMQDLAAGDLFDQLSNQPTQGQHTRNRQQSLNHTYLSVLSIFTTLLQCSQSAQLPTSIPAAAATKALCISGLTSLNSCIFLLRRNSPPCVPSARIFRLPGLISARISSGIFPASSPYTKERSSSGPILSHILERWEPMRARMGESSRSLRLSWNVTVGEMKASERILSCMPGGGLESSRSSSRIAFAKGMSFVTLSSS